LRELCRLVYQDAPEPSVRRRPHDAPVAATVAWSCRARGFALTELTISLDGIRSRATSTSSIRNEPRVTCAQATHSLASARHVESKRVRSAKRS
jgi:hypothetical protein